MFLIFSLLNDIRYQMINLLFYALLFRWTGQTNRTLQVSEFLFIMQHATQTVGIMHFFSSSFLTQPHYIRTTCVCVHHKNAHTFLACMQHGLSFSLKKTKPETSSFFSLFFCPEKVALQRCNPCQEKTGIFHQHKNLITSFSVKKHVLHLLPTCKDSISIFFTRQQKTSKNLILDVCKKINESGYCYLHHYFFILKKKKLS